MHADYTIRALNAGVHALVEKPLAITVEECERMIAAANAKGLMLMTAYRLHTEPGTLEAIDMIRRGEIGEARMFNSLFSFPLAPGNHRLKAAHWGGPLQDIGVYCLNAVRHLFGAEPTEVIAMTGNAEGDPRFTEVEEMIAATLRFPGGRLAQFTCSFGGDEIDQYRVVGTKGQIEVSSGYRFDKPITVRLTKGGKVTEKAYPQYDHFSGQAAYFSDCILKGRQPEADGGDGLADVAIMRAIEAAAQTGQAQTITLPARPSHPTPAMAHDFPMAERQLLL
jgi:predicted dehydrogenase